MNLKEYFDIEMKSTVIYAVIGIIVGYISFIVGNSLMALALSMIVLILTYVVLNRKVKKGVKWWIGNGIIVYIFIWILVWSIFYTMNFYSTLG